MNQIECRLFYKLFLLNSKWKRDHPTICEVKFQFKTFCWLTQICKFHRLIRIINNIGNMIN
jgi:hypothetical protein